MDADGSLYGRILQVHQLTQTSQKRPATHAVAFHSAAGSFLAAHGFALAGDPWIVGRYGGSSTFYRSKRRLSLSVIFDPNDSDATWIDCGREWTPKAGTMFLSNNYSRLAQRFGFDAPLSYAMNHTDPPDMFVEGIVADLKRSLPIVVKRVSLLDLLSVESEEPRGAAAIAMRSGGANYLAGFDISDFSEN